MELTSAYTAITEKGSALRHKVGPEGSYFSSSYYSCRFWDPHFTGKYMAALPSILFKSLAPEMSFHSLFP